METWLILLLAVISALVLGPIVGVIVGKHIVNRQKSKRAPLLSRGESVAYAICFLIGVTLVFLGVFHEPSESNLNAPPDDVIIMDGGVDVTETEEAGMYAV